MYSYEAPLLWNSVVFGSLSLFLVFFFLHQAVILLFASLSHIHTLFIPFLRCVLEQDKILFLYESAAKDRLACQKMHF